MVLSTALLCLAMNIYHEARGEPIAGQIAVANVTMNRASHDPERVCAAVLKRKQFSWTTRLVDGKGMVAERGLPKEPKAWAVSLGIASLALVGMLPDITKGSTHYHEQSIKPYWANTMPQTVSYGAHLFYGPTTISADYMRLSGL